ncbi:MAG: SGNH/GDSL hydrolase family protein [Kiritimatiellae bacterium]|jgi:lysophospholipase L1-like esterase|nr:SGNH/GDSL hydrolase family protein [Kiritimatiellia bacterium]MDD4340732.1 SGNH/GDSL hydrolase family protein [Kiritimatiellia bacterium]
MKRKSLRVIGVMVLMVLCGFWTGCDDGGSSGLSNKDPGNNDINTVVAFGDSITQGNHCQCHSYPSRLGGLIGKRVINTGIAGSRVKDGVSRAPSVIRTYRPGFFLILYGVNDVIHGSDPSAIINGLSQMVAICREHNVVPVLATYPMPITDHEVFGGPTLVLNAEIRTLAKAVGVRCVDLEREFEANPAWYLSDGLHPNDAGTQVITMAFADLF